VSEERDEGARRIVERTMRESHGRAVAVLVGQVRDFDLAEEAVQDAWVDALRTWGRDGPPDNPVAWIVATARRRAIDRLRRRQRQDRLATSVGEELLSGPIPELDWAVDDDIPDERLRLIFTCCHPAIAPESRVALTLRSVAGLTTREIARAFSTSEPTMQQRIVRTKQRITTAGIPYRVPEAGELPERLTTVHSVIYAIFTEGYAATEHPDFVRVDLVGEAIRLAELVCTLLPDEAESLGLLALFVLHDARRASRADADGALVLLHDQDRSTWNHDLIDRGTVLLERAGTLRQPGPFQLQAAIAALHAQAPSVEETDWIQIAALYTALLPIWASPSARIAHAVAIGMADGPDAGLALLDLLTDDHGDARLLAARGHLLQRAGRTDEATIAFDAAAESARHPLEAERLHRRAHDAGNPR
jgi:RNA polymerase sigma-70 factor (ECF subfamily)